MMCAGEKVKTRGRREMPAAGKPSLRAIGRRAQELRCKLALGMME
jgi:hypothetical protein